jgi:hypothetical protein
VQIAPETCTSNDKNNKEYSVQLAGPELNIHITEMYGTTNIKHKFLPFANYSLSDIMGNQSGYAVNKQVSEQNPTSQYTVSVPTGAALV